MEQSKKNKELKNKLDHVIDKSNIQKKILKKILTRLNKQKEDLEDQSEESNK